MVLGAKYVTISGQRLLGKKAKGLIIPREKFETPRAFKAALPRRTWSKLAYVISALEEFKKSYPYASPDGENHILDELEKTCEKASLPIRNKAIDYALKMCGEKDKHAQWAGLAALKVIPIPRLCPRLPEILGVLVRSILSGPWINVEAATYAALSLEGVLSKEEALSLAQIALEVREHYEELASDRVIKKAEYNYPKAILFNLDEMTKIFDDVPF